MSNKVASPEPGQPTFYVASRASITERSEMWRSLRADGVRIVSSWIDEAMPGATADFGELWARIEAEVRSADCLVLYAESGDFPLKGALVEVGMALAMGKPVHIVANGFTLNPRDLKPLGSWAKHPQVKMFDNLSEAIEAAPPSSPEPRPACHSVLHGERCPNHNLPYCTGCGRCPEYEKGPHADWCRNQAAEPRPVMTAEELWGKLVAWCAKHL